jgi:hypothetical protein
MLTDPEFQPQFDAFWQEHFGPKLGEYFEPAAREVAEKAFTAGLRCFDHEFNLWWGNEYALRIDPTFEPAVREVAEACFNYGLTLVG